MQIQINAPQIDVPDPFQAYMLETLGDSLSPFESKLTRIEVHLRDTNGQKGGTDKRCLIEARPRGMDPWTAEHEAVNLKEAFQGALGKLGRVLEHKFGRMTSKRRGE